eukprot:RCo042518
MLRGELGGLPEDLLHHGIVVPVPVDLGLGHQHGDVDLQSLVVVPQQLLHRIRVPVVLLVLNRLGKLPEVVDVLLGQIVKLPVGLLGRGLAGDACVQEVVQVLGEVLEAQVGVVRQNIRCEVVVLVLDVQDEQVLEGLCGERGVLQQEVQLPEPHRGVLLHVHQRGVVQADRVQLLVRARRHVRQRVLRGLQVAHHVLNRALEVEGLHQRGLFQHLGVPHGAHLNVLRGRADAQLGVLADPPLDDLRDVLQARPVVLRLVVTQGDVVRQVGLEPQGVHRLDVLCAGLLELRLLEVHAACKHHHIGIVLQALIQVGLRAHEVVLLVLNRRQQLVHALVVLLPNDGAQHLHSLRVGPALVQRLPVVDPVLLHIGTHLG